MLENYKDKIKELKPFYIKNILPNLISWNEIETLLNLRPMVNDKRFNIVSNKKYKWKVGGWLSDHNSYPPDLINSEIKKYVCYINDCSRVNKKINNVCKELENILNMPTDAHIFFSLKEKETNLKGFGKHHDQQHNLIVCSEGQFIIKVYGDNCIEKEMNNGDAIFVPKNIDHEIIPLSKRLSVSFPIKTNSNFFQSRKWINLSH